MAAGPFRLLERTRLFSNRGQPADAVFYIRNGKIKILVTSEQGKEAVVAILGTGVFFGEEA